MKDSVKPSTYQNYVDYTEAYVKFTIGNRHLQDITVPVLNMLYRQLLASGRSKPDNNVKMYAYWRARQHQRNGYGPKPTDMAKACGTTIYAAQAAATRFRRGRIPQPKSGWSMMSRKLRMGWLPGPALRVALAVADADRRAGATGLARPGGCSSVKVRGAQAWRRCQIR